MAKPKSKDKSKSKSIKKQIEIPKGLRAEHLKDWEIINYSDLLDDGSFSEPETHIILPYKCGSFRYALKIDKENVSVEMLHCYNSWKYKIERLPNAKALMDINFGHMKLDFSNKE